MRCTTSRPPFIHTVFLSYSFRLCGQTVGFPGLKTKSEMGRIHCDLGRERTKEEAKGLGKYYRIQVVLGEGAPLRASDQVASLSFPRKKFGTLANAQGS